MKDEQTYGQKQLYNGHLIVTFISDQSLSSLLEATEPVSQLVTQKAVAMININHISVRQKRKV